MVTILGIDCSTNDKNVAVAAGSLDKGTLAVEEPVICGGPAGRAADVILKRLRPGEPTLLAMDAPLGWPSSLGPALSDHRAGLTIPIQANELFRRTTDRMVKEVIDQQPLDVGADRIARTAHWALMLLGELRSVTGQAIPLAWKPTDVTGIAAIEVYPAATLKVRGISSVGYKKKEQEAARRNIIAPLGRFICLPLDLARLVECGDAIDAVVCVLAGADFLQACCVEPTDVRIAQREGWIWVKAPDTARGGSLTRRRSRRRTKPRHG